MEEALRDADIITRGSLMQGGRVARVQARVAEAGALVILYKYLQYGA